VAAWNWRRTLSLFRNDGAGGFQRRELLPPDRVGYFQLFVDLDADGRAELVSTELLGCARGEARLGLYRQEGEGFVDAAPLRFQAPCDQSLVYQHVAPVDVDRDGRIDLFVSGYGLESRAADFNHFDSKAGERNLLFRNLGGLRFQEEAVARGLGESTRHSYGAAAFDEDEDGDVDLLVVNDFGPNELYRNDGGGRFQRAGGPLTANSTSMGVTVADLDADGHLDVYVSNMESHAASRIVDLVDDRLSPETHAELRGVGRGNAAYVRTGPGRYEDRAEKLGLRAAEWAWGQAVFDADNDGDRDVYVVNGMQSHSREREADF